MRPIPITISYSISVFILFVCLFSGKAQTNSAFPLSKAEALTNTILDQGFQNVSLRTLDSTLIISYENRVYRFEANAVYQLLAVIVPDIVAHYDRVVLITKRQGLSLVAWEIDPEKYQAFQQEDIGIEQLEKSINTFNNTSAYERGTILVSNKNTGNYKIEITIKPTLKLALGGFPDPVLHQINLQPMANLFLWKGAQLQLEGILPISNEIDIPEEELARPGILALHQQLRLPKDIFLGVSAGYFTDKRYGGAVGLKKFFFNGNLLLKTRIGYTGHASYPRQIGIEPPVKGWEYADVNYLDYMFGADYWLSKWNLRLGMQYGKALNQKSVLRLEVTQQFKETEIGFFAFQTDRGKNYGLHIAIPIFPKKYWKPKLLSIRPATHCTYTYRATQNYIQSYDTGMLNFEQSLNPAILKNQLIRILVQ